MPQLNSDVLLEGLRRAYRTLPSIKELQDPNEEAMIWIGQVNALLAQIRCTIKSQITKMQIHSQAHDVTQWYREVKQTIIDSIASLELKTGGYAFAVEQGKVFDYFDETRKILQEAKTEIFLVDPYVSADLVADYFRVLDSSVAIRVLTSRKQSAQEIVPAARHLATQSGANIKIRSANNLHDRFWFVDRSSGYQSSASIKDGGKKAPAVIMKVTDTLDAIMRIYEEKWNSGEQLL